MSKPRHANPLAYLKTGDFGTHGRDPADDLMPRNNGKRPPNIPIDDMQIGPADAACRYLDQKFTGAEGWQRALHQTQRAARRIELHSLYGSDLHHTEALALSDCCAFPDSTSAIWATTRTKLSGLREMESMPCLTRKAAKSG